MSTLFSCSRSRDTPPFSQFGAFGVFAVFALFAVFAMFGMFAVFAMFEEGDEKGVIYGLGQTADWFVNQRPVSSQSL